jgi:hypothetical protein
VIEAKTQALRELIETTKKGIATLGGRGSSEERLREEYAKSFEAERALLAHARDGESAGVYARLDSAVAKIDSLAAQNAAFRVRLDDLVERRLQVHRRMLADEKEHLSLFVASLGDIDTRAAAVRDRATELALERVRYDLSRIVLRADVGIVDTSFARKQEQTEKIGQLQRARAAELTDLTQAYADLTKDEVQ